MTSALRETKYPNRRREVWLCMPTRETWGAMNMAVSFNSTDSRWLYSCTIVLLGWWFKDGSKISLKFWSGHIKSTFGVIMHKSDIHATFDFFDKRFMFQACRMVQVMVQNYFLAFFKYFSRQISQFGHGSVQFAIVAVCSLLMAVRILLVPACNLSMMACSLPMLVWNMQFLAAPASATFLQCALWPWFCVSWWPMPPGNARQSPIQAQMWGNQKWMNLRTIITTQSYNTLIIMLH